ncbi:unnamed protein product, partial [Litomosoides sigmodontis]
NAMPNSLSMNSDEKSEEGRGAFVVANPIDTTSSSVDRSFNAFGFMRDVVLIARTMKDNKGKVLICLLLSVVTGLAMLMIACVISGCYQRRMKRRKNSGMRNGEETVEIAKSTELNTLMRSNHLPSVFLDSNSRICFDIGDLSNNRESFLRFTQLTPPRVPQNMHGYRSFARECYGVRVISHPVAVVTVWGDIPEGYKQLLELLAATERKQGRRPSVADYIRE